MTERPILFSGPMVRALLADRKTQTRRVLKPQTSGHLGMVNTCPYGQPGDRLWVREGHYFTNVRGCEREGQVIYAADHPDAKRPPMGVGHPWRPPIHLPRWACRLVLEIVAVRVERLQDISASDCYAEGCERPKDVRVGSDVCERDNARGWYRDLWDRLNTKTAPWASNPWVWVVEFRRCPSTRTTG
jgi:hypothetical protein